MTTLLGAALIGYCVVMIGVGLYAGSRVRDEEDYLVAGRRLPLWLAWGTLLATWFGAATVLGASATARDEGVRGTLLDPFCSGAALIVAGIWFARPLWEMQLLTTGDLFRRAYGPRTETISSIVQAIGYLPWIAAQYVALATVLEHAFSFPFTVGILLTALFVLTLTMSGGMWSVTLTDTLQILLVLISLVALGWAMLAAFGEGIPTEGALTIWRQTPPDDRTLWPPLEPIAVAFWAATWLNGIGGNLPGQDLMQRVFASRSAKTAQHACILAGVVYILFGLLPVGLGLGSRLLLPDASSEGILLALAERLLSPALSCLLVVALVSIIVSTCTSALLSPAALVAHNLLGRWRQDETGRLWVDRGCAVLITLLSLPLAFGGPSILDLLDVAIEIGLVGLFVPFASAIYGRPRGEWPGLLAIVCGMAIWLGHQTLLSVQPESWLAAIPTEFTGTVASLCGYVVGQRCSLRRAT